MKWKAAILATAMLAGCNGSRMSHSLDGSYGSLGFEGTVDRQIQGENYVYTVRRLDLKFDPEAKSNATDRISNASLRFVATVKTPDGAPYRVTYESHVPVQAELDASHRTTSIRNVEFVVPKSAVDSADHAGLALVDGRLMWPISTELKG